MPNSVVTRVISDRFAAWAASLPDDDQATLAQWMGLDEEGGDDEARAAREDVGRQLIAKLRAFAARDLSDDERAMFSALLEPGLQLLVPGGSALATSGDDVLPRGMSTVLPAALVKQALGGGGAGSGGGTGSDGS